MIDRRTADLIAIGQLTFAMIFRDIYYQFESVIAEHIHDVQIIRRAAIDHNIPLITNARLASAFIDAFCNMNVEDIQIKSWQEYK